MVKNRTNGLYISLGDFLFCLFVATFAILAVHGSTVISGGGAIIDSDLATYAQGMAGSDHPELFEKDPVLHIKSSANSIWNLERCIAVWLTPNDNYAVGLLRAGGVIIVFFYISWYIFGRWLFRRRIYGLLLSILVSITVWVGFGTFWGINHSDPLPRAFHAAFWPWCLMLAIVAYDKIMLRPLAMFVAGLGMWLHGVSALNTGAMFFMAFLLHKPKDVRVSSYFGNMFLCAVSFLLPVLIFLWPSLLQKHSFSQDDLYIFQEIFKIRWNEDFGNIFGTLVELFSFKNSESFLIYVGILAYIVWRLVSTEKERIVVKMIPGLVLGIFCVVIFSIFETKYAATLGRVSMGHELVRGVKFLIPLAWISICGFLIFLLRRLPSTIIFAFVCAVTVLVVCLSQDKQYIAAQYSLSEIIELKLPLYSKAKLMREEAEAAREALEKIQKFVPAGEPVFCLTDSMMAIRYLSMRPLFYTFKDGYVYFYNKDLEGAKQWLSHTKDFISNNGIKVDIIRNQKIKFILIHKDFLRDMNLDKLNNIWENNMWILYSNHGVAVKIM